MLVVASNLINKLFPVISVPIIQVLLGMLTVFLPWHLEHLLEPELFFVLFIAPLLFYDGKMIDKRILWTNKKPILMIAIGLVFLTVLVVGFSVNLLVPSISLAAAFALAAALAPTDAVAVSSLSERVKIPEKLLGILEGEALINDASGIVSFQFAIAAVITGTFSIVNAGFSFLFIALGGVMVGLVFTLGKYFLVRWMRKLGMENDVLHLLIEVLTPFAIYLVSEVFGVSGILAVVTSGITHSFNARRLNPDSIKLFSLSNNTWSVLSFTLNGLVFLLLGTQLPAIISTILTDSEMDLWYILPVAVVLTILLAVLRFVWSILTIKPKHVYSEQASLSRTKTAMIVSVAGVKGTVTLATAMSIPLVLVNGQPFPGRSLILFLASCVILLTLLMANFLLPLLLRTEKKSEDEDDLIYIDILNDALTELKNQAALEDDKVSFDYVINEYGSRIAYYRKKIYKKSGTYTDVDLILMILSWEKEYWSQVADNGMIDQRSALRAVEKSCTILLHSVQDKDECRVIKVERERIRLEVKQLPRIRPVRPVKLSGQETRKLIRTVRTEAINFVLQRLFALPCNEGMDAVQIQYFAQKYARLLRRLTVGFQDRLNPFHEHNLQAFERAALVGFQIEKDCIQNVFEKGKISKEKAKEFRSIVETMEYVIKN